MVQTHESIENAAIPGVPSSDEAASSSEVSVLQTTGPGDQPVKEALTDDLSFDELLDRYFPKKALRRGEIIDGKVMEKGDDGLLVNIGYKAEGIVPSKEMRTLGEDGLDQIGLGDEVIAYVLNPESRNGSALLSIDRARGEQGWRILEKYLEGNEPVKGTIIGSNRGGAVVEAEGVQGFIPLSQLIGPARELYVPGGEPPKEGFVGMEVEFKIIELNRRRNRAIFSERSALQAWKQQQKERLVKEINEGDVRRGTVSGISNFGVFVDIGGADGLIHVSELSWESVKSPGDLLSVGQELDVFILRVDQENLKIGLSLRRLTPEPWKMIEDKFQVGDVVNGKITKITNFGAFARIDGGIEGLIHISEISTETVNHPKDVVNEDDQLDLRIIRIEPERRRLGLSMKQVNNEEYVAATAAAERPQQSNTEDVADMDHSDIED